MTDGMTALTKFNKTLKEFYHNLSDILKNESFMLTLDNMISLTNINARCILNCYQQNILHTKFCTNIMQKNSDFFLDYSFSEYTLNDNYAFELMNKLKNVLRKLRNNGELDIIDKIFEYFQVLTYYALLDSGCQNPHEEMRKIYT